MLSLRSICAERMPSLAEPAVMHAGSFGTEVPQEDYIFVSYFKLSHYPNSRIDAAGKGGRSAALWAESFMRVISRSSVLGWGVAFVGLALAAAGCSCGGGSMTVPMSIMVSLPVSTVVVPQDGTQVIVPINITSTSETALVSVSGMPSGLQEKYAASDTNPSGSLLFTASAATPLGTYTPHVTVQSAGQTASTSFTLIVSVALTENTTRPSPLLDDSCGNTIQPAQKG
jgi:hypothetical protein